MSRITGFSAIAVAMLIVGCGSASGPSDGSTTRTMYLLQTINGSALPVSVPQTNPPGEIISGFLELIEPDSIRVEQQLETPGFNGEQTGIGITFKYGHLVMTGASCSVTFTRPADASGTCSVAGSVITLTTNDNPGIDTRTYVRQ